jgi:hypothetical protein
MLTASGEKITMPLIYSVGFCKQKTLLGTNGSDVRVENPSANQVILVNINTLKGKVYENGVSN